VPAIFRRFWNFMGFNGLLRVLIVEFILVLFSGYVNFEKDILLLKMGQLEQL